MSSGTEVRGGSDRVAGLDPTLHITDLRVAFDSGRGRVQAVDGIDLEVSAGEVLALVGESGSGKSVSMLATMGLLERTATVTGSMLFDGIDLRSLGPRRMRDIRGRDLAMVFQDPISSLNPVHTIGRQIGEVLRLHTNLGRAARRRRVIDLLGRVGIPAPQQRVDDHPHQFSGGMRQRAMIAMALACNPKLLIADEPTTALDVTVQAQIVDLVRDLQAETGMAVIWITHDLGVVAELADRVAVMYAGRILERGTARDVYNRTAHPYTSGLLRSIPRLTGAVGAGLPEIPGSPPVTLRVQDECAFAARCPMVEPACRDEAPPLQAVGHRHHTACIRADAMGEELTWTAPVEGGLRDTGAAAPLVTTHDLRVHFPVRRGLLGRARTVVRAVDGVTLDVRRGTTLGVVGESGCGKTTLGRTMVGLVEPTEGRIAFDGTTVSTAPGPHRRHIQMVFQDPFSSMNPGRSIGDVVAEPIRIHGLRPEAEIEPTVASLLEQVGLPAGAVRRFPHEFSGGQRQRVAVARALAAEPDVIVCDEAVSALDVSVQAQIVNLLRQLQLERNLTYVFIAHDLALVRHICDEVAVMYLGEVVEQGPRDAIYADPLHPYTRALLDAVPEPQPPQVRRPTGAGLTGDLPSPTAPPPGCRFHTRCPMAVPGVCDVDPPALREVAAGRRVACHYVELDAGGAPVLAPEAGTRRSITARPAPPTAPEPTAPEDTEG